MISFASKLVSPSTLLYSTSLSLSLSVSASSTICLLAGINSTKRIAPERDSLCSCHLYNIILGHAVLDPIYITHLPLCLGVAVERCKPEQNLWFPLDLLLQLSLSHTLSLTLLRCFLCTQHIGNLQKLFGNGSPTVV